MVQSLAARLQKSLYLPLERQQVQDGTTLPTVREDGTEPTIYERLGYLPLSLEIFGEIRDRDGHHECATCGDWFPSEELCQAHSDTHQGELLRQPPQANHRKPAAITASTSSSGLDDTIISRCMLGIIFSVVAVLIHGLLMKYGKNVALRIAVIVISCQCVKRDHS